MSFYRVAPSFAPPCPTYACGGLPRCAGHLAMLSRVRDTQSTVNRYENATPDPVTPVSVYVRTSLVFVCDLCNCFHTRPVAPPSIVWLRQVAHRSQRRHVPVRVLFNFPVREACVTFINVQIRACPWCGHFVISVKKFLKRSAGIPLHRAACLNLESAITSLVRRTHDASQCYFA